MVLETQQSSDTTYRFYDWDRVDQTTGQKRPLQIKESMDCTTLPFHDPVLNTEAYEVGDAKVTRFVSTNYFAVYRWLLKNGTATFKRVQSPYALVSVLDGQG